MSVLIWERHTQLQQLSMRIDGKGRWPDLRQLVITSLRFTCKERISLTTYQIPRLASTSLLELHLWNACIPIETWNLMSSSIWPNLTMMDITQSHSEGEVRPLEWMTAAMNAIDKMIHVRRITITDEIHPNQKDYYTLITLIVSSTPQQHLLE
jgi:hypothetical protein